MSFAIIISEKGGQERREVFDKNEISIGRVQGNDLLLPKGNVSKRHARIVFRDGRFIVTDLKSTNGSYVNGHRIAQATIVREGDKIYIGDFILKVDAGAGSSQPASPRGRFDDNRGADSEAARHGEDDRVIGTPPPRAVGIEGSAVSHIPLEQDPDDASGQGMAAVQRPATAAPGMLGGDSRPPRMATQSSGQRNSVGAVAAANQVVPTARPSIGAPALPPPLPPLATQPPAVSSQPSGAGPAVPQTTPRPRSREPAQQRPGHVDALRALLERLTDVIDLDDGDALAPPSETKRASVERVLREQARALQQEGELPANVSADELVREALREALYTGPIGDLLEDREITEVRIARFDRVSVARENGTIFDLEVGFSTEASLRRTVLRLARSAGVDAATTDGQLAFAIGGRTDVRALLPPLASTGTVAVLRKSSRAEASVEELVRAGVLSRPMATFLQSALAARASILITGVRSAGPDLVARALATSVGEEQALAVLGPDHGVSAPTTASVVSLGYDSETSRRAARTALAIRADRTIVDPLQGIVASVLLDAIGAGTDGVIAVLPAASARQAIARIASSVAAGSPGIDAIAARSMVATAFDLIIEVGRMRSGKQRILRISELAGADLADPKPRDLFEFVVDATQPERGDGVFQPTGVVPSVIQELKALGHRIDDTAFRRGAAVRVP